MERINLGLTGDHSLDQFAQPGWPVLSKELDLENTYFHGWDMSFLYLGWGRWSAKRGGFYSVLKVQMHSVSRRCHSMLFILTKVKLNAPLSLIFPLCLGQVKWHCKARVSFPIIIKVLGTGAFQELQYSLEKSTIPSVSSSQYFSCSSSSKMVSWLTGCYLSLLSGAKPSHVHNMLRWTQDLFYPLVTHQREPFKGFCLVQ